MSGSRGNTSSSSNREARSPRNTKQAATSRAEVEPAEHHLAERVTEAARGAGIQQRNAKHPKPDNRNASARRKKSGR